MREIVWKNSRGRGRQRENSVAKESCPYKGRQRKGEGEKGKIET